MKKLSFITASLLLFASVSFASIYKQDDKNKANAPHKVAPAPKTATPIKKPVTNAPKDGQKLPPPSTTNTQK